MSKTVFYKIDSLEGDMPKIRAAADIIRNGGLVGIPTETVYGLAANALDEEAVKRIFEVKGRPANNPLIVHIANMISLINLTSFVPQAAYSLAEKYWPGPLTIVLPKSEVVSGTVSGNLETVAIRMPSHPVAREIIKQAGVPIAAPSANISGRPSPTTAKHVLMDMDGKIDAIVDGGECSIGVESTVVSLCGPTPRLLRPGGITLYQLEKVLKRVEVDRAVMSKLKRASMAASPGMLHKHYAPKTKVVILKGTSERFAAHVNELEENAGALCFDEDIPFLEKPYISYGSEQNPETLAYKIFDALREVDDLGVDVVYAHCPPTTGIGLAVYNRILRAADFNIFKA